MCSLKVSMFFVVLSLFVLLSVASCVEVNLNIYVNGSAASGYLCWWEGYTKCVYFENGSATIDIPTLPMKILFFNEEYVPKTNFTVGALFEVSSNATIDLTNFTYFADIKVNIVDASPETTINASCIEAEGVHVPLRNGYIRRIYFNTSLTLRFPSFILVPPQQSIWMFYNLDKLLIDESPVSGNEVSATNTTTISATYYPILKYNIPGTTIPIYWVIVGLFALVILVGFFKLLFGGARKVVEYRRPRYLR